MRVIRRRALPDLQESVLNNVARCLAVAHDALCDRQQPARLVFVDRAQCEAFSARARFNGSFVIEIAGDSIHRSEAGSHT